MGRGRAFALTLAVGALAACGSDTRTVAAVPVPERSRPMASIVDGDSTVELLEGHDGCVRLLVRVGDRHQVDPADRCPGDALGNLVAIGQPGITFNDRRRTFTICDDTGDCPARPTDRSLSAPVAYGRLRPPAAAVCVPTDGEPLVLRPDEDGYLLDLLPGASTTDRLVPLLHLADGRRLGQELPDVAGALVERCRRAVAPGAPEVPTSEWYVLVEGAGSHRGPGTALFLATDTGFFTDGLPFSGLSAGGGFRLLLHADTTEVAPVVDSHRATPRWVPMPEAVRASLRDGGTCATNRMTLHLDDELAGELRAEC